MTLRHGAAGRALAPSLLLARLRVFCRISAAVRSSFGAACAAPLRTHVGPHMEIRRSAVPWSRGTSRHIARDRGAAGLARNRDACTSWGRICMRAPRDGAESGGHIFSWNPGTRCTHRSNLDSNSAGDVGHSLVGFCQFGTNLAIWPMLGCIRPNSGDCGQFARDSSRFEKIDIDAF